MERCQSSVARFELDGFPVSCRCRVWVYPSSTLSMTALSRNRSAFSASWRRCVVARRRAGLRKERCRGIALLPLRGLLTTLL